MLEYTCVNSHHIGASHVKNQLSCEDYSLSVMDQTYGIAVISDGHGDKNCPRSAQGAKIACETAVELIGDFCETQKLNPENSEELLQKLEKKITLEWKKRVLKNLSEKELTEEELQKISKKTAEEYRQKKHPERAYGCTLIAAVITEKYWFAVQIGDGTCVAVYEEGAYLEPVPVDEECCGNRSTSICAEEAEKNFRHYFSEILPIAVFVVSDGIQESFDTIKLYNCFYSVAFWVLTDKEEAFHKLKELLPKISAGGSGDDVSIAGLIESTGKIKKPKMPFQMIYDQVESVREKTQKSRLEADECRIFVEELAQKLEETNSELEKIIKRAKELKHLISEYEISFDEALDESELKNNALQSAEKELQKAESYLSSAKKFWEGIYAFLKIPFFEKDEE